jgi:hypothetical protein
MKVAHTPGPWIRKGEQIWNQNEAMYCAAANFDCIMPSQTLEANARLIAASPTLLETLQLLELQLSRPYAPDGYMQAVMLAAARAAVAMTEK